MYMIFSAVLSCLLVLCLTPMVIRMANRHGWYDSMGERKIHSGKIPRLGGIAMFWAFFASVAVTAVFSLKDSDYAPWGSVYWPTISAISGRDSS
jgi:UDP-N-acetylmuramyl pentapeptide phosphotransferase/UDP-N-acetylglucosamine-1-phosphate transferase